ncbi:DUF1097 domain-containing protein [Chromatiaceae bacterium AAb-1]|nr:DUF1097 domain-containing protein [Chromatiaceae bacterium AAb-1]
MVSENTRTQFKIIAGESAVAAGAATLCALVLEVPVWAMFIGWISYFTRGFSLRHGVLNLASVLVGLVLGIGAALLLMLLNPLFGIYTISVVVMLVAMIALSLAKAPLVNNLLGFFLGLVAYFASHLAPSLAAFTELAVAITLGAIAAWLAHALQLRIQRAAANREIAL